MRDVIFEEDSFYDLLAITLSPEDRDLAEEIRLLYIDLEESEELDAKSTIYVGGVALEDIADILEPADALEPADTVEEADISEVFWAFPDYSTPAESSPSPSILDLLELWCSGRRANPSLKAWENLAIAGLTRGAFHLAL